MKTTEAPVIVTSQIKARISEVWKAISERSVMIQWFFDNIPDFKPEVGFETSFQVHNDNRIFTHDWKVVNVIPEKQLSYNWKYREYEGDSIVHFYLEEQNGYVSITVKVEILKDFPSDIPEFERSSCEGGWTYFIPGRLKSFLESN